MEKTRLEFSRLRGLIGASVVHNGIRCRLVEVLEDERSVVLEACHRVSELQSGQGGGAVRRVPKRHVVRIFSPDGPGFSDAFLALGLLAEDEGR